MISKDVPNVIVTDIHSVLDFKNLNLFDYAVTTLDGYDMIKIPDLTGPGRHLRLQFADVEYGTYPNAPTIDHIKQALDFYDTVTGDDSNTILFHCYAGISRSTAMAIGYLAAKHRDKLDVIMKDDLYKAFYDYVKTMRRYCYPNKLIIGYFDQLLNLDGSLYNFNKKYQLAMDDGGLIT